MMKHLSMILFTCCAFLVSPTALVKAQSAKADSLRQALHAAKGDTIAVKLYLEMGDVFENSQPDSATYYYRKARDLSQSIDFTRGLIQYMLRRQYIMVMQGQYDSALLLCQSAAALAKEINDKPLLASATGNTGSVYLYTGDKEKALSYYLQFEALLEQLQDTRKLTNLYSNLSVVYQRLNQFDNAVRYTEKAVALARKHNYRNELGFALSNLGATYVMKNEAQKAMPYLKEALAITREVNNMHLRLAILINMSTIGAVPDPEDDQVYNKAYLDEALLLSRQLNHKTGLAIALRCLADYYFHEKQFGKAKDLALQSLQVTREFANPEDQKKVLGLLSHIAAATLDFRSYEKYYWQRDSLAASLVNEELAKSVKELELKYESEKKESQISQLQREQELQNVTIRQKTTINLVLGGLVIIIVAAGVLVYRNHQQRQLLQQQTIRELQTERLLLATDAVLQGQEDERSRLAKDLHDGLGGILSGAKFTFDAMKDNMIMTPDNQKAFTHGMELLETSIRELRRVAHNMMPESLVNTGLPQAVKDLCADLQQENFNIIYQEYSLEGVKFNQTISITVYRIIQELLNNAMKHAQASEVIVQLSCHDQLLQVTVEDNGRGVSKDQLEASEGMGWSNIRTRVDYLKGAIDVNSISGRGTSVTITLPVGIRA